MRQQQRNWQRAPLVTASRSSTGRTEQQQQQQQLDASCGAPSSFSSPLLLGGESRSGSGAGGGGVTGLCVSQVFGRRTRRLLIKWVGAVRCNWEQYGWKLCTQPHGCSTGLKATSLPSPLTHLPPLVPVPIFAFMHQTV